MAARAGGNPLFAEELTLAVAESGADGARAVLPAAGAASALPATLQGLLTSRLERLGAAKAVAQIAATIGHAFSLPMLEAVAETDPAALAEALDRLAEAEVIVPEGSAGVDYRFRHALIRDAVYQSQGPALRHQAHARVARALEVTFPEQAAAHPELVALHLTEAGQERAAIAWWVRGGTRARQRAAYAGAIEQLRRGLDLLPAALPPGPDRDRIELEIKVSLGISLQATLGLRRPRGRRDPRPRARAVPDGGGRAAAAGRARRPLPLLPLPERFPVRAGDGRAAPAGDRDHRGEEPALRELLGPRLYRASRSALPRRRARTSSDPSS